MEKKMEKMLEKLTPQEEEAMLAFWRRGKAFIREILDDYADPKPPYTTLASVVKNLERKGYVTSRKMGNTYRFEPAIAENAYKRTFLSGVVKDYFRSSYRDMVAFFATEQDISAEELKEIVRMIENKNER